MMLRIIDNLKKKPIITALLLGGILRLVFLLFYYFSPQWNHLLVDSLFHDRWALSIASGNILGQEPYFRAPFYIYILGLIYSIFGHSLLMARIFGHLSGLIAVYLTYGITLRLFSRKTAVAAALIHAIYPLVIYFESELLVDSFFTMLVELSVLLLLISLKRKQAKWYLATGLIIGLAVITRPILLALVPIYVIWLFFQTKNFRLFAKAFLLMLGTTVLIIAPVTLRNLVVANDLVLVSTSGGINFYIGNNETSSGLSASMPPPLSNNWQMKDIKYIAEQNTGYEMKDSEISYFWFTKGLRWIINNKSDFLRLYLKKLYYCLNNIEISNNRDLNLFFKSNPILHYNPINYSIILSLAIFSFVLLIGQKKLNYKIAFIIVFISLYFLVISLFFINARFRLPALPFLIIISSYGVTSIIALIKSANFRAIPVFSLVSGAMIFIISSGPTLKTNNNAFSGLFNQANYYQYTGDYNRAIDLYHQFIEIHPNYYNANSNLGATYLKMGYRDSAEFYFTKELNYFPSGAGGYSNLASLYYLDGQYNSALDYVTTALNLKPYFVNAHLLKMRIFSALNDTASLAMTISGAIECCGCDYRIYLEAGIIYSNWGIYDLSAKHLNKALEAVPAPAEINDNAFGYTGAAPVEEAIRIKAQAAYQLGFIYGIQGRITQSIDMSRQAIDLDSGMVEAYINLINGYIASGIMDSAYIVFNTANHRFPQNRILKAFSNNLK